MAAFEQIYRTYSEASYYLAYRICGCEAIAQEISHDAFIKVMANINKYRGAGSFAGWVRRIVANEAINHINSEKRQRIDHDVEVVEISSNNLFEHNWLESCRDLDTLTEKLPSVSRAVLILHQVEGYKHQEIAEMFGKSVSFSKVTLNRAFASLRQLSSNEESDNASNRSTAYRR